MLRTKDRHLPRPEGPSSHKRRQWGADRNRSTLPVMSAAPGRRAISGARFALLGTGLAWCAYIVEQVVRIWRGDLSLRSIVEAVGYLLIVTALTGSAAAYLLTRLGHLERARAHRRVPRSIIDAGFEQRQPSLTVLVPSYREEARVIRQTLLSAALQEYPAMRIVLLVDDPPAPTDPEHALLLQQARDLPAEIELLLEAPRQLFVEGLEAFEARTASSTDSPGHGDRFSDADELELLAEHYDAAAATLQAEVDDHEIVDHSDEFLVAEVFGRLIDDLTATAEALRTAAASDAARISHQRTAQLYRRLVWLFTAELSSFERKRFASLSHEANKAMNLNSYIGLMGGTYRVEPSVAGDVLLPEDGPLFDLEVPNPDYVLTLDADSILLPEYCMRLVSFMEQPEHQQVAVVQTPYSSYRGARHRIERLAGATTDLQHLAHQGMTAYGATFWVGANAVLRKTALDDIVETDVERGFVVRRYVQDRTVIEDTESSIDLRAKGWQLHNYPERLSYSATPPDFGSLVVQRQRWANGGLVILPKLRRLLRNRKAAGVRPAEAFLRLNYLASVTWASIGLLVLLCYPFDSRMMSRLGLLTALPYFVAMANDLRRCGYKRTDVLRLYGFNLLLLPVNLSGTVQSVVQAIGGQKIAFARTPKVADRTVAPLSFVAVPFVIVAWSAYTFARDLHEQAYIHAGFAAINGLLTLYAAVAFVGLGNAVADIALNLRERMYRPARRVEVAPAAPDWVTVLYHGSAQPAERDQVEPLAVALAAHDQAGRHGLLPPVLATLPAAGPATTGAAPMRTAATGSTLDAGVPAGAGPAGAGPAGAEPVGTEPGGTVPSGTILGGTVPMGTVPMGTVPDGTATATGELVPFVERAAPAAPAALRFDTVNSDTRAAAELLAECIRVLSEQARVTLRPDGGALELSIERHDAPGTARQRGIDQNIIDQRTLDQHAIDDTVLDLTTDLTTDLTAVDLSAMEERA